MKKNIFIILAFLLTGLPRYSLALSPGLSACVGHGTCEEGSYTIVSPGENCETYSTTCYGADYSKGRVNCKSCPENYKLTTIRTSEGLGCYANKTICEYIGGTEPEPDCDGTCDGCSTHPLLSYENLTADPGYAMATASVCNTETCMCMPAWYFSCADGYYGTASCNTGVNLDGTRNCTGCTKCPTLDGVDAFTQWLSFVAPGGSSITDCFIKANIELNDSTGTYVFESKCNYKR